MSKPASKVIWAVDAFSTDSALNKKLAQFLKGWVKGSHYEIEPVYVLSPDQLGAPIEIFSAAFVESEAEAKKGLQKILRDTKMSEALPPVLLRSNDFSLRSAIKVLVEYARQNGAELIAMGTQSQKGTTRFLFGSFAESLALYSDVPVLMLTPQSRPTKTLKNIFFATDFSAPSRAAFVKVMDLAEKHRMGITIFNKVEYVSDYTAQLIRDNPSYAHHVDADLHRRGESIAEMAAEARARHLKVTSIIESKPNKLSVAESILKAVVVRKGDLIAVASQSGPFTTTILGSVARQIIRQSKTPVWVIHPERSIIGQGNPKVKKGAIA